MLSTWVPLIASMVSGIYDAFTGEIPEMITVPLIISGLAYAFLSGYFFTAFVVMAATGVVGYILYYTGQLGGGDVLLLMGISAWKPFILFLPTPLAVFMIATLLSALFYGVFYMVRKSCLYIIPLFFLPPIGSLIYGSILSYFVGKSGEFFKKEKKVEELVPEDVLAEEHLALPKGKRVLEKKDIEVLKEKGVENVIVLEGLPRFGPFIFLSFLILLFFEAYPLDLYDILLSLFFYRELNI